jgi:mRNA interferase MazF
VEFRAGEGGLSLSSVLLTEQLRVIDKERLIQKVGIVSGNMLAEVSEALRIILELENKSSLKF